MRSEYGYSEENHQGNPKDLRLLKRLLPLLKPYRALFAGSVALVVILTLTELALPYFSKLAVDRYILPVHDKQVEAAPSGEWRYLNVNDDNPAVKAIIARHSKLFEQRDGGLYIAYDNLGHLPKNDLLILRRRELAGLGMVVLLFLAVVAAGFGLTFAQRVIMERAGHRVMHDLRMQLFDHVQQQSMAFFSRQPTARLVTRITNDVQNMHELFTTFVSMVFKDIFVLIGIAIVFTLLDARLAIAVFAVLPLVIWAAARFSVRARGVFRALRAKVAEINAQMAETIDGIRTIQTFVRETHNYDRFDRMNQENYRLGMEQIHVFALFMPIIEVLALVSLAVLILYGGIRFLDGTITLGDLVLAISYVRMFFRPIRDLAENYNVLQNAMASAERIFGVLDDDNRLPTTVEPSSESLPSKARGTLELRNVSFAYNTGEWVLRDVSFSVATGRTVAVVGPTGAGKTSLLNLIQRFYDPDEGTLNLDGVDLRHWDTTRLRSQIALVTQEPVLFSASVRENIFPEATDADTQTVNRIITAANCADLVNRLPQGLDTVLEKGGAGLSSGERQLITIARALARDARLILLDEATSYIDSQTEAVIYKALENLIAGRTCVIVAHRLSTARMADQIVVLQQGQVVEIGSHETLIEQRGLYAKLHERDRQAADLPAAPE